jgi:hypothetical protein
MRVTLEIEEAIKHGYKILEIYDPITKTGGLFSEYIKTFLKIKQEASGYPDWVKTEADKDKYINEYFEKKGIFLYKSNIKYNEAFRTLMKLLLTSLWRRLAMNSNKPLYKLITNPAEWFALISDEQNVVQSADFTHKNYL